MLELRQILVPYDFSSHSEAALQRAAWLAAKSGARLHILHACALPVHGITPYEVVVPTGVWDQIHASAAESLEEVRAKAAVDSGADVTGEVTDRLPGEAIQSAIDAMPADLVVMGTRGLTGLKHAVLGSVAERTLRTAPCPVLAVKEDQGDGGFSKIAVGVDFSDPGEKALDAAASWARELGAELHVVHAFDLPLTLVTPYEVAVPDMLIREAREAASTKLDGAIARPRA
jgi:nucleotide-binding universal stress UspA family protein